MLTVRPADRRDAPLLSKLSRDNCADGWSESAFLPEFDRGSVILTAEAGGSIIGFAVVTVSFDEGYLQLICVDPDRRRQGAASELLSKAEEDARQKGARKIVLDVRASNSAALELYKKSGYTLLCKRAGFYSHPLEDAFTMVKEL